MIQQLRNKRSLVSLPSLVLLYTFAVACDGTAAPTPPGGGGTPPGSTVDAGGGGGARDGGATGSNDAGAPFVSSGCPAPRALAPSDAPSGYLPAQTVGLIRAIDGDTAEFGTQSNPGQKVRFLFVNTEESYGSETTEFGQATGALIRTYLESAGTIVLRVREDRSRPGQPNLDPYDRWLSLVFVDGDLFQTRIVREGLSAYYTQFGCAPEPVHSSLLNAEAEARANKRGIWRDGHPTDYRRVFQHWIGSSTCRPNPYENEPYCRR